MHCGVRGIVLVHVTTICHVAVIPAVNASSGSFIMYCHLCGKAAATFRLYTFANSELLLDRGAPVIMPDSVDFPSILSLLQMYAVSGCRCVSSVPIRCAQEGWQAPYAHSAEALSTPFSLFRNEQLEPNNCCQQMQQAPAVLLQDRLCLPAFSYAMQ